MSNVTTWEQAVRDDFAVPADTGLTEAAAELTVLLGSPDQHARDEVAYELLSTWIARGTFDDLLVGLGDGMCAGLRHGLGEDGTDSVFRRSFSALVLASVVERDTAIRVLHPSHVLRWADAALHWFVTERDLRGHAGPKGWVHAVAHGADLIAALGDVAPSRRGRARRAPRRDRRPPRALVARTTCRTRRTTASRTRPWRSCIATCSTCRRLEAWVARW